MNMKTKERVLKCVLLVDDDEMVNHLHRCMFEEEGISKNIQVADSVNLAMDLLKKPNMEECQTPDLIFLDLNMPGLSGWDFLDYYEDLKKDGSPKSLIIILTNSTNPYDHKKAESYSTVAGFRSKPLTDLMIHEIINSYF